MTSATERLRALLTEHGVEWRRTPHYSSESIDNETVFRGDGIEWYANDHLNGRLGLRTARYEVTPEQAIDATLGRGTCEDVGRYAFVCSECGWASDEPHHVLGGFWPKYCPECGKRVVE